MNVLVLAAALQASPATVPPALPSDEFDAAMMCEAVAVVDQADKNPLPLKTFVRTSFFVIVAARARPTDQAFGERMVALSNTPVPPSLASANIPALMSACDARFPKVVATNISLPTDPLKRDLLCSAASSLYAGMANTRDGMAGANDAAPLDVVRRRFLARLTPARLGADRDALRLAALKQTVDYGTVSEIERSCAALPGE